MKSEPQSFATSMGPDRYQRCLCKSAEINLISVNDGAGAWRSRKRKIQESDFLKLDRAFILAHSFEVRELVRVVHDSIYSDY